MGAVGTDRADTGSSMRYLTTARPPVLVVHDRADAARAARVTNAASAGFDVYQLELRTLGEKVEARFWCVVLSGLSKAGKRIHV